MTEAVKGMFKFLKQNDLATRVEALHLLSNPASGRVMQRTGMTFEGILRKRIIHRLTGESLDAAIYSILAEEIV